MNVSRALANVSGLVKEVDEAFQNGKRLLMNVSEALKEDMSGYTKKCL